MTKLRSSYTGYYPTERIDKYSPCFDYANGITTEIITTNSAFQGLKQAWNQLVSSAHETHPFILWEWQHTWWDIFSETSDKLFIIVVYQNNQAIGIAPFYLKRTFLGSSLRYLGEGENHREAVCTHYPDIICSKENSEIVIDEIARYLNRHKRQWDYAHFSFVLNNSLLHKLKKKLSLYIATKKSLGHRYLLNLPETNDVFLATLGRSTKKNFRSKRNRMKKQGELSLTQLDLKNAREESLDKLANLHRIRQINKNETSAFDQGRFHQFHQKLLNSLADTNITEIKALKHGDEIVAVAYNLIFNKKVFSYASGFNSQDDKRFSPMLVFDFLEIESLIERGFKQYDFLSAENGDSYKKYYRCEESEVNELCWFNPTNIAFCKYQYLKLRGLAKKTKQRVQNINIKMLKFIDRLS